MKPTDTNVEEVHSELAQPEAPRNGHKTVQIDRLTGGSQADPVSEPAASPAAESSTTCVVCNAKLISVQLARSPAMSFVVAQSPMAR